MSAPQPALIWPDARGWLILSGQGEQGGIVRTRTLHRLKPDGGVAYLGLSEASADATMDDLDDLGAPTGYLVNILLEDDPQIQAALRDVSLIVLDGGEDPARLYDALQGAALEALNTAYLQGAVILAEGSAAALFGGRWLDSQGRLHQGINWLKSACVMPGIADRLALRTMAQHVFESVPETVAVGVPNGSALVLGPEGQLELWGDSPVAVTFGPAFARG